MYDPDEETTVALHDVCSECPERDNCNNNPEENDCL